MDFWVGLQKPVFWTDFMLVTSYHSDAEGIWLGIVKNDVLERFYGDNKYVNYRVLKENIAKTCKHTLKNAGFGEFSGKNADNGAKCRLDSFFWALSSWLFQIP